MKTTLTNAIAVAGIVSLAQQTSAQQRKRALTRGGINALGFDADESMSAQSIELIATNGDRSNDSAETHWYGKSGKDGGACFKSKSSKSGARNMPTSAVYTMTNQPGNKIIVFTRDKKTGKLVFKGTFATGGDGSQLVGLGGPDGDAPVDDPLGSTGSIVVAGKCLLAVNAGSDTVSAFRIKSASNIELVEAISTEGVFPVSIAEQDGLVYVLNAGENGSFTGFTLSQFSCQLNPGFGTTTLNQSVTDGNTNPPFLGASPAQIGFTPGNNLLVTIKQNGGGVFDLPNQAGSLNVYNLNPNGSVGILTQTIIKTNNGGGTVPFSFTFDNYGRLLLIEVAGEGNILNGSQMNLYNGIEPGGDTPKAISEAAAESTASCWVEFNPATSCVYTTNNAGNSISAFSLDGEDLELIDNEAALLVAPIDMVQSPDNRFLYALATEHIGTEQPVIYVYEMLCDCSLRQVQAISDGLPDEATRTATGTLNGIAGLALF